eukprot:2781650-Rhodomonas_salina.4
MRLFPQSAQSTRRMRCPELSRCQPPSSSVVCDVRCAHSKWCCRQRALYQRSIPCPVLRQRTGLPAAFYEVARC